MLDFRIKEHNDDMTNEDFYLVEGRARGLCELAERTLDLPLGNVAALIDLQNSAVCMECGERGRIDSEELRWVHCAPCAHSFDLIGELDADSPLLRLVGSRWLRTSGSSGGAASGGSGEPRRAGSLSEL